MLWSAEICSAIEEEEQACSYHLERNGLMACVKFCFICTELYTDPEGV